MGPDGLRVSLLSPRPDRGCAENKRYMFCKSRVPERPRDHFFDALSHLTRGDGLLIGVVVMVAAALFFCLPRYVLSGSTDVEILSGDRVVGTYSLYEDRLIQVSGPLGTTVVRIKGGRAAIVSSPCPHGICMHMDELGPDGGFLACVPNQVIVRSVKERTDGLDAVTK
jgi:hypothetical protein